MDEASPRPSRRSLLGGAGLLLTSLSAAVTAEAAPPPQGEDPDYPGEAADRLLLPGFRRSVVTTDGVAVDGRMTDGARINTLVGGKGPPLLLLHDHPETHLAWHKVAVRLAERFTVVLTDLRGYGDSSKPDGGPDHANYCKRAMEADQVQVMRQLCFGRFQAVRYDRGGRVLQFMMLDHPEAVERSAVLGIAPMDGMYGKTTEEFATRYFWWFFHIQPRPAICAELCLTRGTAASRRRRSCSARCACPSPRAHWPGRLRRFAGMMLPCSAPPLP